MKNFPARLRELRGSLTQKQAADLVGIKQQNWARYESGQVLPGAEAIHNICVKFNASADWLLGLSHGTPSVNVDAMKISALKGAIQAILDKF